MGIFTKESHALIGFDGAYKAYRSTTGASEVYFRRESADGHIAGVRDFVLVSEDDGGYALNSAPSESVIQQFDQSAPADIQSDLSDINLDGAIDLVLFGVNGSSSVIVYAPTTSNSPVRSIKQIDEKFVEFFTQIIFASSTPHGQPPIVYQAIGFEGWVYSAPFIGYHNTADLFLSGQPFTPFDLGPGDDPIPFYANVAEAHDSATLPRWCLLNGPNGFRFENGVWKVWGEYRHPLRKHAYEAQQVGRELANYWKEERTSTSGNSDAASIFSDILGIEVGSSDEASLINIVKLIGVYIFGIGVEQETIPPETRAKVSLLYTRVTPDIIPWLGPFEIYHTYLEILFPNGHRYVTRGGPQEVPAFLPFGYLEAQAANNNFGPIQSAEFLDLSKYVWWRQHVGFSNKNESEVGALMRSYSSLVNRCERPYLVITQNSNSYAFTSVERVASLRRPFPQKLAPGALFRPNC